MLLQWMTPSQTASLPSEAVQQLLTAALAKQPHRQDLRLESTRILFRMRRLHEVVKTASSALGASDGDAELFALLGRAAAALDDVDLALRAFQAAVERGGDVHGELAEAFERKGDPDSALATALEGLRTAPNDFAALALACRVLLARGKRARVWELAQALVSQGAWGGYTPSALAHGAESDAQRSTVAELFNLENWLSERLLTNGPELLVELSEELQRHPRRTVLPVETSTRGEGARVDDLEIDAGSRTAAVLAAVQDHVQVYVRERRHLKTHPMMRRARGEVRLRAWAISVRQDGYEQWHVHPDGWISGVLYVDVPAVVQETAAVEGAAGAIQFGPLPLGQAVAPAYVNCRTVTPRPAKLLLFPSYLGHRTWASGSADRRTCIAFDVVPA